MEQLADIFLETERHPYNQIGSPLLQGLEGGVSTVVTGFAIPQLFPSASVSPLGPLTSVRGALESIVLLQLQMICTGKMSALPLDNYLINCWKPEMIPELCSTLATDSTGSKFFLKHNDDKG
jgi:hypothetical protein